MAVDSFAKRMAVGGMPFPLGTNVFPGTTSAVLGRAAAAWNYVPSAPVPPGPGTARRELTTLGTVLSFAITPDPVLGGRGSW